MSNEGIGFGTPSQRQKQFQQYKVARAADRVVDYKTQHVESEETSIAIAEKKSIKKGKVTQVIDRLVEDLIQEAMSKGEFRDLPGKGKPLKLEWNPFVG